MSEWNLFDMVEDLKKSKEHVKCRHCGKMQMMGQHHRCRRPFELQSYTGDM